MTQIVFNVDPKVKARALKRAKRERVSFESVLTFATQEFADGRLSVSSSEPEKFNAKTAKGIRAALRDIEKGKDISPAFNSGKEMDAYLGI